MIFIRSFICGLFATISEIYINISNFLKYICRISNYFLHTLSFNLLMFDVFFFNFVFKRVLLPLNLSNTIKNKDIYCNFGVISIEIGLFAKVLRSQGVSQTVTCNNNNK